MVKLRFYAVINYWGWVLSLPASFVANGQSTITRQDFKPVKAIMSNIAADAVGVNTHLNFDNTLYNKHYEDIIKPRLIELGVKHIRDHLGGPGVNARYADLAHNYGIKLLLINNDSGDDLDSVKNEVKTLNNIDRNRPVVDMIEPANERDVGWKNDWGKLCVYMNSFTKTFKGDKSTSTIPLLGPSFANTRESATSLAKVCGDISRDIDFGNLHAYSGLYPESPFGGGWGISFDSAMERYGTISLKKPLVESETGYKMSEGMQGHPAVSQRAAAKYSPRLILSRLQRGVSRLYFYQLINAAEDFGMLNDDGSPRLQYTSLKNFIHLMADEGPDFTTGTLKYALGGNTQKICQMLFQKRNGIYMLVIWQGVNGSDNGTKNNDYRDVDNPDQSIVLKLTQKAASITVYKPSFNNLPDGNGIIPVAIVKNRSAVRLSVPDHVLVVEINIKK